MTDSSSASKSFKIIHWIVVSLLFIMMAQPTYDNINALLTGSIVMGEVSIKVSVSKMSLHILATLVGWVGLWWFIKRQKKGAFVSIAAHFLGLVATLTQTPEMLKVIPPVAIAIFFVVLLIITLGPVWSFKDQYS